MSQRIEGAVAATLAGQRVTVQAWIYNGTGATITPQLYVSRPAAADNFSALTVDIAGVSLQACPAGAWTRVAHTFDCNAGAAAGLQVGVAFGVVVATQTVRITEADIRVTPGLATGLNSNPPPPELRPIGSELALCQRYYEAGAFNALLSVQANNYLSLQVSFKTTKRVTPTVVTTTTSSTNLASTPAATNTTLSETMIYAGSGASASYSLMYGTYTASAEL